MAKIINRVTPDTLKSICSTPPKGMGEDCIEISEEDAERGGKQFLEDNGPAIAVAIEELGRSRLA